MNPGNHQVLTDAPRTMALSEELHALPPPEAAERLKKESDDIGARVRSLKEELGLHPASGSVSDP